MIHPNLIANIALLLVLSYLFGLSVRYFGEEGRAREISFGISFGLIGGLGILFTYDYGSGVVFDGRSIVVSLAAFIGGPLTAAIALVPPLVIRIIIGGGGMLTGLLVLFSAAATGLLFRRWLKPEKRDPHLFMVYLLGLVVHIITVALFFTLPQDVVPEIFRVILFPFLVLFPVVNLLIYMIMKDQETQAKLKSQLRENNRLLEETGKIGRIGGWELDAETETYSFTAESLRILGIEGESHPHGSLGQMKGFPDLLGSSIMEALIDGRVYDHEMEITDNSGKNRQVRMVANPLFSGSRVVKLRGTIQDITELRHATRELRDSEERFRRAFDNIPDIVLLYNRDLRVQYVNPSGLRLSGLLMVEFRITPNPLRWPADIYGEYVDSLKKVIDTGTQTVIKYEIPTDTTYNRYCQATIIPVLSRREEVNELMVVIQDETDQVIHSRQVSELEKRFRETLENVNLVSVLLNRDGTVSFCNDFLLKITGYKRHEVIGNDWFRMFVPDSYDSTRRIFIEGVTSGIIRPYYENEIVTRDGRRLYIRFSNTVLRDSNGEITGTTSIGEDITETRRVMRELKESEAKYRQLVEIMPAGLAIHRDGVILYANSAALGMIGAKVSDELIGRKINEIIHPDELKRSGERIRRMLSGEKGLYPAEDRYVTLDGRTINVEVFADTLQYDGEMAVQVVVRDITEQKRTEQRVLKSLIDGADMERNRIAKDMHDGLGQNLTAASMNLNLLKESAGAVKKEYRDKLALALEFVNNALEESRSVVQNLMPRVLVDLGLAVSLESLVNNIRRVAGFDLSFFENIGHRRFRSQVELNLYRITQEALSNIIKHSRASRVEIKLVIHDKLLTLMIEDDGCGFDVNQPTGNGLGLTNIRNRSIAADGILMIDSSPGLGTTITVEIDDTEDE